MSTSQVLICPPTHYGIEYEINPWMSKARQVDSSKAMQQWQAFRQALEAVGVDIHVVESGQDTPDMVFTANAGLVVGKTAVLSHFHHSERQGEEPLFERWFSEHGYTVVKPCRDGESFEGAGDALPIGDVIVAGYGFRSDATVYDAISQAVGKRIVTCELVDPYFYHIDTCFSPINDKQAVIYRAAFTDAAISKLEAEGIELLDVPASEAKHFVCNMVTVGKQIIMPAGCPETKAMLEGMGYSIHEVEVTEYIKAGGACRCLTLFV